MKKYINKAWIPKLRISTHDSGMKRSDLPWVTLYLFEVGQVQESIDPILTVRGFLIFNHLNRLV